MKKAIWAVFLLAVFAASAYAADDSIKSLSQGDNALQEGSGIGGDGGGEPAKNPGSFQMPDRETMMHRMQMLNPMLQLAQRPVVIPTQDGGIVVQQGMKLTKYDPSLKYVAELNMTPVEPKEPQAPKEKAAGV